MRTITTTTKAGDFEYEISYKEFEDHAEILSTVEGGDATVASIVNASQRQNALQGGKAEVLKAVNALKAAQDSGDAEAIAEAEAALDEAVNGHRETALGYVIGKPRGGAGGGPTKKTKASLGERITEYTLTHGKPPSQKELADMMRELGITAG